MSLKKNIVASYASQMYIILTGIVTLPLYIRYMGAEAYGLVGFFTMLQTSFSLLDLGLTPTIARETARFRAGSCDAITYRRLFRALSMIFMLVALVGGAGLFVASEFIGQHWLKVRNLDMSEVQFALQVMAISVALRWMTGLYRGVVSGSELLVWLSGFNVFIASLRFLVVFPVMWRFGATPSIFFGYQLFVAFFEYSGLWIKSKWLLPVLNTEQRAALGWSFKPVKSILGFSMSIALTSGIWVLATQTDKLIMSKLLTLEDYGYFSLAVLVASGIMIVSGPISGAIMPRLVKLEVEGKKDQFIQLYRDATQLVTVISGSATIVLAGFAKPILYVWTNDESIAKIAAPIMSLYAIGYGFLAIAAFPYYLQYAKGKLNLHIIGSLLYIAILLPALFWATKQYGMVGAGYAWIFINSLYFVTWTYIVHNVYAKGIHLKWLFVDVLLLLILPLIVFYFMYDFIQDGQRFDRLVQIIIIGIIAIVSSAITTRYFRIRVKIKFKKACV